MKTKTTKAPSVREVKKQRRELVRAAWERMGSQRALAEAIGVRQPTVSRWASGANVPSVADVRECLRAAKIAARVFEGVR